MESDMRDWFYDEFQQIGVDYSKIENTDNYDEQMESFRDYDMEAKELVDKLGVVSKEAVAVDFGCGTGAFSIHAAKHFKKVYAVDISKEMLDIASSKAKKCNIENIEFVNSGFLNFSINEKVDLINTKWAFHHLPDFWKQAALLNMNNILKLNGALFLSDVVFKFDADYEKKIELLINKIGKDHSDNFASETKVHIRDEYSTFDWIIKGMLERAGFEIKKANIENVLQSEYFCRKIKSF